MMSVNYEVGVNAIMRYRFAEEDVAVDRRLQSRESIVAGKLAWLAAHQELTELACMSTGEDFTAMYTEAERRITEHKESINALGEINDQTKKIG